MQTDEKQIIAQLKSENNDEIRDAAFTAGENKLAVAVPLLTELLHSPNLGVQEAADRALRKIGGKAVLYSVLPLLRSEDPPVRNLAMDLLREVGESDVIGLTELMHDDDPDLRIFGADILGSTKSSIAVPALCDALLHDPESNVRYQAAVSLGELSFPEAAESLNRALEDEEWVQFAVIDALLKIGAESSVDALYMALGRCSDLVASIIVDVLGSMGYIKAVPLLLRKLPSANVPLANKIVRAIVNILGPKSLKFLSSKEYNELKKYMLQSLEDEDTEIQDAAIKGLSIHNGDEEFTSIFKLLSKLDNDRDHDRMDYIISILASMGYHEALEKCLKSGMQHDMFLAVHIMASMQAPQIVPLLKEVFWTSERDLQRLIISTLANKATVEDKAFFLDVLERHDDGNIIRTAIEMLGRTGDQTLISTKIFPLLEHKYDDVKQAALEACIAASSSELKEKFMLMSKHEEEFHRMMAYYALGSYGDNMPYLIQGLNDNSPAVRKVIIEQLGTSTDSCELEFLGTMEKYLHDSDRDVRLAVVDALGRHKAECSEKYLLEGMKDEDPWVRARCVETIGQKHLSTYAEQLAEHLTDGHLLVVIKTIEALAEIGGEVAFRYILPMLSHEEAEVQRAAEEAITKMRNAAGE